MSPPISNIWNGSIISHREGFFAKATIFQKTIRRRWANQCCNYHHVHFPFATLKRKEGLVEDYIIIIIKDLDSFKLKTAFSHHFGLNNKVSLKKGEVKVSLTHDGKIQFPSKYFCYQLLRFEMCCQHWILTVSTDIDFLLNSLYSASKDLCSFSIISLDFLRSWNQGNATELRGRDLKNKIGHTISNPKKWKFFIP